jgi:hypothetical protein
LAGKESLADDAEQIIGFVAEGACPFWESGLGLQFTRVVTTGFAADRC